MPEISRNCIYSNFAIQFEIYINTFPGFDEFPFTSLGAAVYICAVLNLGESCSVAVCCFATDNFAEFCPPRKLLFCGCAVCVSVLWQFPHLHSEFNCLGPDVFACLCKPTFLLITLHLSPSHCAQTTHDPVFHQLSATIFSYLF